MQLDMGLMNRGSPFLEEDEVGATVTGHPRTGHPRGHLPGHKDYARVSLPLQPLDEMLHGEVGEIVVN
jgi:hypothetical protein